MGRCPPVGRCPGATAGWRTGESPGRPEEAPSAQAFIRRLEAEPVAPVPLRRPGGGAGQSGRDGTGRGAVLPAFPASGTAAGGAAAAAAAAVRGLLPEPRPSTERGQAAPAAGRLGAAGRGAAAGPQGRRGSPSGAAPGAPPGSACEKNPNLCFASRSLRAPQCRESRCRSLLRWRASVCKETARFPARPRV